MITTRIIFLFLVISLANESCDPSYGLLISNGTKREKQIKIICVNVTYPKFWRRDSIRFINNINPQKAIKDSLTKSFSFKLPPGQIAIIDEDLGYAPWPIKKIIIDGIDSVVVAKNPRITNHRTRRYTREYKLTLVN